MPAFRFEAVDADGRTHTGLLEADTARAVRQQLRAREWVPLGVTPLGPASATSAGGSTAEPHPASSGSRAARSAAPPPSLPGGPGARALPSTTLPYSRRGALFARAAFSRADLAIWTRQLAGLVGAGLPLERALSSLADEAEDARQAEVVAQLRAEVHAGQSFARALASAPEEFDEIYRAVIDAGEQGGALDAVLDRLAEDLEQRQALRARLAAAALYPAIVSAIALLIVMFLLTYVVPQVAGVFAGSRRALPGLTVAMLGLSAFAREWGWAVVACAGVALTGFSLLRRRPAFRERSDAAFLRLPLVGPLVRGYNAARFAATLAMLAGSGVPILKALQAAAQTVGNRAMRADALTALVQVREGAPLGAALAAHQRLPALLAVFARLGEQTGQLPQMLNRAAQQLSSQVQRRALALATVLEPLLIVAMGLVVLLIVLAVMLPIIQLNAWVR